jgi:exportin-2 (importin alpha re-exporter)
MKPFLQLVRQTSPLLLDEPSPNPALTSSKENYALIAQATTLLLDIYYDFSCQDLPPDIEDSYGDFFTPGTGVFHRFLAWDPAQLKVDVSELFQAKDCILNGI